MPHRQREGKEGRIMKKPVKTLLLFSAVMALASCGYRTDNAYDQGRFFGPFIENFYSVDDFPSVSQKSEISTDGKYQNGYLHGGTTDGNFKDKISDYEVPSVTETYPDIFGGLEFPGSYIQSLKEEDSYYIGKEFGRTKCLGTVEPSFKDTGVLSKLYNGLLRCHGEHNYALVQFKEEGMNSRFPKTCGGSSHFLMTFRGGSAYDDGSPIGEGRISYIDLNLRFFYEDGYVSLSFPSVPLTTNWGANYVNLFGFSFQDMGIDPSGMIGYGLSYSNFKDDESKIPEEYVGKSVNDYWGLLVYEVMLLDSTWH